MTKIKLGGLKLWEGGAQVVLSSACEEQGLAGNVTSHLAAEKINIALLGHVSAQGGFGGGTTLCVARACGSPSASLLKCGQGKAEDLFLRQDVSILSIFPHAKRLDVFGRLLIAMSAAGVEVRSLATSPSAIAAVVSDPTVDVGVDTLFRCFQFTSYATAADWRARLQKPDRLEQEIIASYEEKVIKIYGVVEEPDLDLWLLLAPFANLATLGAAMKELADFGLKAPFLVAIPGPEGRLLCAFCMATIADDDVERVLTRHLPPDAFHRRSPVAALFLHGPHFGDRHGIAHALIQTLERAGTEILALSCAVASISVIIDAEDLAVATGALVAAFSISRARV